MLTTVIYPLLGLLIGSLLGAVVLRIAATVVAKKEVAFGNAYLTVLLASLASIAVGLFADVIFRMGVAGEAERLTSLLLYPLGFLIQSWMIQWRVAIPFGRACLVSLVMVLIYILLAFVLAILYQLMFAML